MGEAQSKTPKWYMPVVVLAFLWNLMGVMAYVMQVTMGPEMMDQLPEAERALYEAAPAWQTGAFAVAVFAGALGTLLLILKKNLAVPVLIVSLVAVLVQMSYTFFMSDTIAVLGPASMVMPLVVIAIAVYLVILARSAKSRGWLS
jgi:lipid-A-disaccharide synthase-like uncharacterized protein